MDCGLEYNTHREISYRSSSIHENLNDPNLIEITENENENEKENENENEDENEN